MARLDVPINGDDVGDVLIVTGRPGMIRGRVISDDGTPLPFKPSQLRLFAQAVDPTRPMMGMIGRARFGTTGPSSFQAWLDDIRLAGGVEVTRSVVVVPSRLEGQRRSPGRAGAGWPRADHRRRRRRRDEKVTALSGLISDDRNQPVTDASVVVFPEDRERWVVGGRYVRLTRPDTNGKYEIRLTPAANYRVVVVRGLEHGQFNRPRFLTRAIEVATAFDIGEGEAKVLNLRLAEVK